LKPIKKDRRKKVTIALKKLATKDSTLKNMIGLNFTERCIQLHRMMPEVMIKRTTLHRIYKEYNIRNKVIKKIKVIPECSKDWAERATIDCRDRIAHFKKVGIPVIYCDESVLSSKLLPSHAWIGKS
jgi:hypothetical protein